MQNRSKSLLQEFGKPAIRFYTYITAKLGSTSFVLAVVGVMPLVSFTVQRLDKHEEISTQTAGPLLKPSYSIRTYMHTYISTNIHIYTIPTSMHTSIHIRLRPMQDATSSLPEDFGTTTIMLCKYITVYDAACFSSMKGDVMSLFHRPAFRQDLGDLDKNAIAGAEIQHIYVYTRLGQASRRALLAEQRDCYHS